MALSAEEQEFATYVTDLMQSIGPVGAKRMFGGYGIFLDGVMFALIADSVLYLKTDKQTEADFLERGLGPFTYSKQGKEYKMSYYQAPDDALEDADEMNAWANKAYRVALSTARRK